MAGRGRPRKYTPRTLRKAVERYFGSITRRVRVTENVPTGAYDEKGHMLYEPKPVVNSLGEEVWVTEYIVPRKSPRCASTWGSTGAPGPTTGTRRNTRSWRGSPTWCTTG